MLTPGQQQKIESLIEEVAMNYAGGVLDDDQPDIADQHTEDATDDLMEYLIKKYSADYEKKTYALPDEEDKTDEARERAESDRQDDLRNHEYTSLQERER